MAMNKVWKFIKIGWILIAVLLYLFTGLGYLDDPKSYTGESALAMYYSMFFITFPIGYLLSCGHSFINYFLYSNYKIVVPDNFLFFTLDWLLFFSFGYFQWFVLFPHLFDMLRKLFPKKNKIS
jgi:hypothetical protein